MFKSIFLINLMYKILANTILFYVQYLLLCYVYNLYQ
jgi:hypothetical protein